MKNKVVTLLRYKDVLLSTNILSNKYVKTVLFPLNWIHEYFRKNLYFSGWIIKYKNIIFASWLLGVIICSTYFYGFMKSYEKTTKNYGDVVCLLDSIKINVNLEKDLKRKNDSVRESKDFIRYTVFKETGMLVPNSIPAEHLKTMYESAKKKKIPLKVFFRMIYRESEFKSNARNSSSGASGYLQLMPETYNTYRKVLHLKKSPKSNIIVGSYYLKEMYNYWKRHTKNEKRRWTLALASYNAGIAPVIRYNSVPNYPETQKYVRFVLAKGI